MPVVSGSWTQSHFRFYNDDGSESTSTAYAAQDTNVSVNAYSNANILLRIMMQETGGLGGAATDDWQLQYSKNGGAYTSITTATSNVKGYDSTTLTDQGATTNRLTGGTGSFVAGLVSEDGLADNLNVTANNYSEFLFTLTIVSADVSAADTLDFRLLVNGSTNTYSVTPRITVTKTAPAVSTTNFLIGYAEIPLAAGSVSISTSESTTYPLKNLFGGDKADYFKANTAVSGDHLITFSSVSPTKTANFLFLAKANLLKYASVGTITLKGHSANNYAAATTVQTVSSFGSATMVGPHLEDYITTFTTSSAYAYWFVNYNCSATSVIPHSKLFVGNLFDPGKDPDSVSYTRIRPGSGYRKAIYTFTFGWQGLTRTKTEQMHNVFSRTRRMNPVILYTQSYHELLDSHRVILARVTDFTAPPRVTDYNDVSMTFEELI